MTLDELVDNVSSLSVLFCSGGRPVAYRHAVRHREPQPPSLDDLCRQARVPEQKAPREKDGDARGIEGRRCTHSASLSGCVARRFSQDVRLGLCSEAL